MNRSILKSIRSNEFENSLSLLNIKQDLLRTIKKTLFDKQIQEDQLLLKQSIKDYDCLCSTLNKLKLETDLVEALKNLFYIDSDLNLPQKLRNIFDTSPKIAIFVGAGISKLCNVPLWDELANLAIKKLRDMNYVNDSEYNALLNEHSAKQKISIFHSIVKDEKEIKKFYTENLKCSDPSLNPYRLLYKLESATNKQFLKITTNIDTCWEDILEKLSKEDSLKSSKDGKNISVNYEYSGVSYMGHSKNTELKLSELYKIHGCVSHIFDDPAVLTSREYIKAYSDEKGLRGFLKEVFSKYDVIFLGTSLQEFELLEHCLKKNSTERLALLPVRYSTDNLFRVKKSYFEDQLNITPIKYYSDFQSYDRLSLVLERWIDDLKANRPTNFYDKLKTIDEALNA